MRCKNSTKKSKFYLPIIHELKLSTNLNKIQEKLSISKQQLNYYLRQLKESGFIIQKGRGWYEPSKKSKNSTNHGIFLRKDMIRGHAYVWTIDLKKKPKNWDKRLDILKRNNINYKLVGAKETTPRIKVLGRKIWLCNDNLRIFDKKGNSYYGEDAKESRYKAFYEIKLIVNALNNKLGIFLKPSRINFQKEHYALIKNDLAIEENKKGNIVRISDEEGEWLLIDDSLEMGGELETVGKKSYKTNIPMQKWWNDNKKHKFEVTPTLLLESINQVVQVQKIEQEKKLEYSRDLVVHKNAIDTMSKETKRMSYNTDANSKSIELLADVVLQLKEVIEKK